MDERRTSQRSRPASSLEVLDRKTGRPVGQVGDITDQGMMLNCEKYVEPDTVLQLKVVVPEEMKADRKIIFDARSIWCKRASDSGIYRTGFQLLNVIAKDVEIIRGMVQQPQLR